jgi:hypothetical protein
MDVRVPSETGEPLHQIVVNFLSRRDLAHYEGLLGQILKRDLRITRAGMMGGKNGEDPFGPKMLTGTAWP